jgi:uncharacterized membrane protein
MTSTITKYRVTSIDFLRGTIMIIMALDHVRDYLFRDSFYYDPMDFSKTSGVLFFTRWITHFCAPIFMLLAGASAYFIGRTKTKNELSVFLFKRGLWLVFLELVVTNFGWNFNITFPMILLITIWALGLSMIVLGVMVQLPKKLIFVICIILVFGHNLLDGIQVTGNTLPAFGWAVLHVQQAFFWGKEIVLVGYPIVPWIGVMPLGYLLGNWYAKDYDAEKRKKNLLILGLSCIVLFIILRYSNLYGDPDKWSAQKDSLFTFMSFLNVTKYPPSLLYLLMTLGGAFLFLSFAEKAKGAIVNAISVYGRVPMFYYLIHIYVIHLVAMVASAVTPGQNWKIWILDKPVWFTHDLQGYGFSLPVAYLIWIAIVIALYPLCKRYDRYKQAHKEKWWLSYL